MTRYTLQITEYDTDNFPSEIKRFRGRVDFSGPGWPRYLEIPADTRDELKALVIQYLPGVLEDRKRFNANMATLDHEIATEEIEFTA